VTLTMLSQTLISVAVDAGIPIGISCPSLAANDVVVVESDIPPPRRRASSRTLTRSWPAGAGIALGLRTLDQENHWRNMSRRAT
jgi:hypothetical protein